MDDPARLLVACLCAEWCGTCRDYRTVFDGVAAQFAPQAEFRWIDIEDHADGLGDLDVDTFPTLLIARDDVPLFFGPLTPQAAVLARTVVNAVDGELPAIRDALLADLTGRVRGIS